VEADRKPKQTCHKTVGASRRRLDPHRLILIYEDGDVM
jgi:hypothetical protein